MICTIIFRTQFVSLNTNHFRKTFWEGLGQIFIYGNRYLLLCLQNSCFLFNNHIKLFSAVMNMSSHHYPQDVYGIYVWILRWNFQCFHAVYRYSIYNSHRLANRSVISEQFQIMTHKFIFKQDKIIIQSIIAGLHLCLVENQICLCLCIEDFPCQD